MQCLAREDQRLDPIIFMTKFDQVLKVARLQYLCIEVHLSLVLNVLADPLVDEWVTVLFWVQVRPVGTDQVEEANELIGPFTTLTGDDPSFVAVFYNQLHEMNEVLVKWWHVILVIVVRHRWVRIVSSVRLQVHPF